jgi:hypothetical protein
MWLDLGNFGTPQEECDNRDSREERDFTMRDRAIDVSAAVVEISKSCKK